MDDQALKRLFVVEKFFPNPQQILFGLFVHRNAGPDPGMDEEEIAATVEGLKRFQEVEMLLWQRVSELVGQPLLFVPVRTDARLQSVGQQRFKASAFAPLL